MLALPVVMTMIFGALFVSANPLIARSLAAVRLPPLGDLAFCFFAFAIIWPSLRPDRWATRIVAFTPTPEMTFPGVSRASVRISLGLFNVLFAIENALDIGFLWGGAPLPAGVTLADYAHRGAYPLILTALLAGAFVLATTKPGSATAADPTIRRLVVLWVAQNLILVASSILRTCDYIAVYMLTSWRIAALVWMGLVALGLVLICWRMLSGRSTRWLVNANASAAALVLATFSIVDFDTAAAEWNVAHAREVGGDGGALDLCQLNVMGAPALLPLIELEKRELPLVFRDRVTSVRQQILEDVEWRGGLVTSQADWRNWTWRNARRLAEARRRLGPHPAMPAPQPGNAPRTCDGSVPATPSPPVVSTTRPLTGASAR